MKVKMREGERETLWAVGYIRKCRAYASLDLRRRVTKSSLRMGSNPQSNERLHRSVSYIANCDNCYETDKSHCGDAFQHDYLFAAGIPVLLTNIHDWNKNEYMPTFSTAIRYRYIHHCLVNSGRKKNLQSIDQRLAKDVSACQPAIRKYPSKQRVI